MAETRYPWGYGRETVSLAQIELRLRPNYHPEFLRRFIPWLESKGGHIGVGGHFRTTQPAKPGFAPEGKSFHQAQDYRDGVNGKACAIDLVATTSSGVWRSPYWHETPKSGTQESKDWGLHTFIKGEPWHIQPIEIRGWSSWRYLHRRRAPEASYPIPGGNIVPTPDPIPDPPDGGPTRTESIVRDLPTLKPGSSGDDVRRAQALLNTHGARLVEDGHYGNLTENSVRLFQGTHGLTQDGWIGTGETWPALLGV